MGRVPAFFWILVGVGGLFAYSLAHRRANDAAAAAQQSQEASTPLQPFTQPQPPPSPYLAYGQVPFGTDAVNSTQPRYQVAYTSQQGQLA